MLSSVIYWLSSNTNNIENLQNNKENVSVCNNESNAIRCLPTTNPGIVEVDISKSKKCSKSEFDGIVLKERGYLEGVFTTVSETEEGSITNIYAKAQVDKDMDYQSCIYDLTDILRERDENFDSNSASISVILYGNTLIYNSGEAISSIDLASNPKAKILVSRDMIKDSKLANQNKIVVSYLINGPFAEPFGEQEIFYFQTFLGGGCYGESCNLFQDLEDRQLIGKFKYSLKESKYSYIGK